MQRISPAMGNLFGPVEEYLQRDFLPELFQLVEGSIPGWEVTIIYKNKQAWNSQTQICMTWIIGPPALCSLSIWWLLSRLDVVTVWLPCVDLEECPG